MRTPNDPTNVAPWALATIEAWHDARFQEALTTNPGKALEMLVARYGLDPTALSELELGDANGGSFAVAPNPVGVAPAERWRLRARKSVAIRPTTRIVLSPEQRESIRQATGRDVAWLELTPEALEGEIAPDRLRAGRLLPSTWDC
jgi:hypothetical protein